MYATVYTYAIVKFYMHFKNSIFFTALYFASISFTESHDFDVRVVLEHSHVVPMFHMCKFQASNA